MRSIRIYLIVVLLSLICLANFLAALQGYRSSLASAERLLDQQLAERALLLGSLLEGQSRLPKTLFPHNLFFQVWEGKTLLYRSQNVSGATLIDNELGYHFISYEKMRWRVLALKNAQGYVVVVGQRFDAYVQLIEALLLETIAPIIWVVPLLVIVIWLIVQLGLSPLKLLAKQLLTRQPTNFSRINEADFPKELVVVVSSINQMLARLSEAFDREHRFASDAAHELRTPLTSIKLGLHNLASGLSHSGDTAYLETFNSLETNINLMTHTIEQLLSLYRLTPETFSQSLQCCDLEVLVKSQIVECYSTIQEKGQVIELRGESVFLPLDEFSIKTLVRNLIDNASKYSPRGSRINVTINHNVSHAMIRVEDSGPGIPASEYGRVFSRFYRAGADRHASNVSGCGLGLSIVEHVVKLHQGQIFLSRSADLVGLSVEVTLPLRQPELEIE